MVSGRHTAGQNKIQEEVHGQRSLRVQLPSTAGESAPFGDVDLTRSGDLGSRGISFSSHSHRYAGTLT